MAVTSNIDDDLFALTTRQLGVAFDLLSTSEQARAYKPDQAIIEHTLRRLGVLGTDVMHVAEGTTEIAPARRLGCASALIRRNGRSARLFIEAPDLDVADLWSLVNRMGLDAS